MLYDTPSLLDSALPGLTHSFQKASTDVDFEIAWKQALKQRFQPISISHSFKKQQKAIFLDDGVKLLVSDVVAQGRYELVGKRGGNGLFNSRDIQVAQSLFELTHAILKATHAREEATLEERTRIMRDLHDSLGAKLLSMAQRCRGMDSEDYAREALQTLRDTVHLSTVAEQLELLPLLGEWRMETRERLEVADAKLHWHEENIDPELKISSAKVLLLLSFLRETVSNALKHARPGNIYVRFTYTENSLQLLVGNDGGSSRPEAWKVGFGLSHLRERLVRAGGSLTLGQRQSETNNFINEVVARIPL
ncbi:MAG: hypothetical protein R3F02_15610 [Thiolinea sp.]